MPEQSDDIRKQLQDRLRLLTVATVVLALALLVVLIVGIVISTQDRHKLHVQDQRLSAQTKANTANEDRTTDALCALRADLQQRVKQTADFLKEHPSGIPGISAQTLRNSVTNSKRSVKALSNLRCPHKPKKK